jgi:hypothetical protein
LNHSQSRIQLGLIELDQQFQQWLAHPNSQGRKCKLIQDLEDFRWQLDQHFARIAGEEYLERAIHHCPSLYPDLRDIECWQNLLMDKLDHLIQRVRARDEHQVSGHDLAAAFRSLQEEIEDEEREERELIERSLVS